MSEGGGSTMSELRVAALISDMDGVLIDTGGVYDRHWERGPSSQGISPERIVAVHFGRPAAETIRLVAPELDAVAEARRFNDALADDPSAAGVLAMPGALELASGHPGGALGHRHERAARHGGALAGPHRLGAAERHGDRRRRRTWQAGP